MKKMMMPILFFMSLANAAAAAELTPIDAVIDRAHFDGSKFQYRVTAYDASEIVKITTVHECITGEGSQSRTLKAIEIKVLMTANFNRVGGQPLTENHVFDVRKAIRACMKQTRSTQGLSPIEVILPRISIPSLIQN